MTKSQNPPQQKPNTAEDLPLISVIVPVYNVADTLSHCVESICTSDYKNLEIFLIDDGSTDRSGEICDKLAENDPRIKVVHQNNTGLSAARNRGLDLMKGKYVTFVDSDDAIQPEMISYLYEVLAHTDIKMSICSFYRTFPDCHRENFLPNRLINRPNPKLPEDGGLPPFLVFDTATCLTAMLCEDGYTMSAWGKLYASELFDNVRFPEGKLYEDVGTTYRLILQCPQVIFLPVALYDYLQTPSSIIHRPFEFSKLDLISQTDQMCEDIETTLASRDLPRHLRDALRCRRMHARFSILRQMVLFDDFNELSPENRQKFIDTQSEIINYLKTHKNDVLKNPAATSRDRLAMRSLGFGLPAFKMAWKIYSRQ